MRTSLSQPRWQRADGSALMAAAIAAAVLGLMVVSYLTWVTNEYRLSKRSHAWAQALNLCEAGVELGLAELNYPYRYNGPVYSFQSSDGWAANGSYQYTKSVTNVTTATGASVGSFTVTVAGLNTAFPTLTCTGTCTAVRGPSVTRILKVVIKKPSAIRYALTAKSGISQNGGSAVVDSYDSQDPSKSTNGQYDIAKRQANGNLTTANTSSTAIQLTGNVYGDADTGPGGHVTFGAQAWIGPTFDATLRLHAESAAENAGWITHDFITTFSDVVVPTELTTAVNVGAISTYTFNSGDYRVSSISLNSGSITVNGNVRLYVTGDTTETSAGAIFVKPGSTLTVYTAGNVNVSGGGVINQTGYAINNQWYGLNSSTAWTLSGSSGWIGTAYAPSANLKLTGNIDYYGGFVADTLTQGGQAAVHYDEALARTSGESVYGVAAWEPLVNRNGSLVLETN
jgi:hypothetical protein